MTLIKGSLRGRKLVPSIGRSWTDRHSSTFFVKAEERARLMGSFIGLINRAMRRKVALIPL